MAQTFIGVLLWFVCFINFLLSDYWSKDLIIFFDNNIFSRMKFELG